MAKGRGNAKKRGNPYDEACRFVLHLGKLPLLLWLLGMKEAEVRFESWASTETIPWPGHPNRRCDTVAWILDLADGDRPWLIVAEFQIEPDPDMLFRLMEYMGALGRRLRPGDNPKDRFCVGAVVVNLTGEGA